MTTKDSITQFVQTVGLPLEHLTPPKCIIKISMGIPPNSQLLFALSCLDAVSLRWVPKHRGIEGNEKADQLVKEGVKTLFTGQEPVCGVRINTQKIYSELGQKRTSTQMETLS